MTTTVSSPPRTKVCPKCGYAVETSARDCPRCSVVLDKVHAADEDRPRRRTTDRTEVAPGLHRLVEVSDLVVRQRKEKWEILTGFECKNQYRVTDGTGQELFQVAEEGDGAAELLVRWFLKAARPFTMHVYTPQGTTVLVLKRPFRFFFHKLEIHDADGTQLGSVEWRFSLLRRIYEVVDNISGERYEIVGPFWKPWTFHICKNGRQCGVISKKWSGTLKEVFTDADNFGVSLPPGIDPRQKAIFLGTVFLIDAAHFENTG